MRFRPGLSTDGETTEVELNYGIKGIEEIERYVEELLLSLPYPDPVVLPELSLCSYMTSREI